ncbi:hypothetical protein [Limosilactobacillus antri]|uniref:hypothetical protein n=1 Tax=Limosilactobacillus antri TaxID=227943 RepID=UPI0011DDE78D|nr:hypothetical protein [Limosilactobacillus antri]
MRELLDHGHGTGEAPIWRQGCLMLFNHASIVGSGPATICPLSGVTCALRTVSVYLSKYLIKGKHAK